MSDEVLHQEVRARLFDQIPSGVVVLDPSLTITDHNKSFASLFGEVEGELCYRVTKRRETPCPGCPAQLTFEDGQPRVIEQHGKDRDGRSVHYLVHITPIPNGGDGPSHVAAITTDLTATRRLQREYMTLFEKVPCFVAVINREHRVVRANERFRETFGVPMGECCYLLYKGFGQPCTDCPVDRTFIDGESHTSRQIGISRDGRPTPYLVVTAPLFDDDGGVQNVIEMALDLTEHQELETQLQRANVMSQTLVCDSMDAIVIFDEHKKVLLANNAAEALLGYSREELIGRRATGNIIPKELNQILSGKKEKALLHQTHITNSEGEKVPVRIAAVSLKVGDNFSGAAIMAQDLRELTKLQREKVEAERLAAVGQTVAGLAHGIKNILTGIEGGMYVTSSGFAKGDQGRIQQGWEMLERNIGRISVLARSLLSFSRGETVRCTMIDPGAVVNDVVELYREATSQRHIVLTPLIDGEIKPVSMDQEAIHSCLANLISNAVDACLISGNSGEKILVHLYEKDETIVFEVSDTGCGMDYEIKQKVFTSFFTTKERGGTGLGLLLTRKIVQQHGGSIVVESEAGEGTTFRLSFPRDRLPSPEEDNNV